MWFFFFPHPRFLPLLYKHIRSSKLEFFILRLPLWLRARAGLFVCVFGNGHVHLRSYFLTSTICCHHSTSTRWRTAWLASLCCWQRQSKQQRHLFVRSCDAQTSKAICLFLQFPWCDDAVVLKEPLVLCVLHCVPLHWALLHHEPGITFFRL